MAALRVGLPVTEPAPVGWARAEGTCGELVQGVLATGEHFHVTCPIRWRAAVALRVRPAPGLRVDGVPFGKQKLTRALLATARLLGTGPVAIEASARSVLPVGKGMGSSTADVVAGARALASAYGTVLSPTQLATIATAIEPSDGTMYNGVIAFCRRTGEVLRTYPWYPRFSVVMAIPPGSVRTESVDFAGKARLARQFEHLLAGLDEAAARRDPLPFAHAATRSAALNQRFLANRLFLFLHEERTRLGAAGVVVGHTGTLAGLLYPLSAKVADGEAEALERACAAARVLASKLSRVRIAVTLTTDGTG